MGEKLDTNKMRKVSIKWLADNMETWRENALLTNLPRAYIRLGKSASDPFHTDFHQIVSVIDPLPSWTVGATGLYTVWLANDLDESLELEGDYVAWLDDSDVQPMADWSEDAPDWVKALGDAAAPAAETAPTPNVTIPAKDAYLSVNDGKLQITFPEVEGYDWAEVFKAHIGTRIGIKFSVVVGNFVSESEAADVVGCFASGDGVPDALLSGVHDGDCDSEFGPVVSIGGE